MHLPLCITAAERPKIVLVMLVRMVAGVCGRERALIKSKVNGNYQAANL